MKVALSLMKARRQEGCRKLKPQESRKNEETISKSILNVFAQNFVQNRNVKFI